MAYGLPALGELTWGQKILDSIGFVYDAVTDSGWHEVGEVGEPEFQNGWVNFGPTDPTAAYRKIGSRVHLKGMVRTGTPQDTDAGNVFILPVGYRPLASGRFAVASSGAYGQAIVLGDGRVRAQVGSSTWFSLSGISFLVD